MSEIKPLKRVIFVILGFVFFCVEANMSFYTSEKRLFGNKQSAVQCTVHVEKEFIFNSTKTILGAT